MLLNGSGLYAVPAAPAVADSTYYIHADRLGSNVVMTDANAKVVAKTEYTAYGAAVQNTSKDETAGYTGHYEDPLTGLTYMQARYYDADLGRFLSVDPIQSTPGDIFNFARYAYANNNPMMFTDPTGMVAAACRSDAVMNSDGSWSVTGSGCIGGVGGTGGVAGWFPGWGGSTIGPPREPGVIGGGRGPTTEPTIVVTAAAPPKVGWGSGTLMLGMSGSFVTAGGPVGGLGLLLNPGIGDSCFDIGLYFNGGIHAGFNVGASANLAYSPGPSNNVSGATYDQFGGIMKTGLSASWPLAESIEMIASHSSSFKSPSSYGLSVGPGVSALSYSVGASHTASLRINQALRYFGYNRCGG